MAVDACGCRWCKGRGRCAKPLMSNTAANPAKGSAALGSTSVLEGWWGDGRRIALIAAIRFREGTNDEPNFKKKAEFCIGNRPVPRRTVTRPAAKMPSLDSRGRKIRASTVDCGAFDRDRPSAGCQATRQVDDGSLGMRNFVIETTRYHRHVLRLAACFSSPAVEQR